MSNLIVTGKTAEAHISSADDGALYAGIFGIEDYILNIGNKLDFEQTGANTIRVYDGDFIMQGRQGRIPYGSTEDVQFTSGTVGFNKITYIAVRYELIDGLESMELISIDGELSTGTPEPPELTQGNIFQGDTVREVPLVMITFEGVNISDVSKAPGGFITIGQIDEMKETIDEIRTEVDNIKSLEILDIWNVSNEDYELMSSERCRTHGVVLNDDSHYDAMKNADFILITGNKINEKHVLTRAHRPQNSYIEFNHFKPSFYYQNGYIGGTINTRCIKLSLDGGIKEFTAIEIPGTIDSSEGFIKWEAETPRMLSVSEPMKIIIYKYPRE